MIAARLNAAFQPARRISISTLGNFSSERLPLLLVLLCLCREKLSQLCEKEKESENDNEEENCARVKKHSRSVISARDRVSIAVIAAHVQQTRVSTCCPPGGKKTLLRLTALQANN
jgi:hypothetical protein